MANCSFSLTTLLVIDPVLKLRADLLDDPNNPPEIEDHIAHFGEAEIAARVIAAFVSFFAVGDLMVHAASFMYKGLDLTIRQIIWLTPSLYTWREVACHFRHTLLFAVVTVAGSILGVIQPNFLKMFRLSGSGPEGADDDQIPLNHPSIPPYLRKLAEDVRDGKEVTPFTRVEAFWQKSDLQNKHLFVQVFNRDDANFQEVRRVMTVSVYRPAVGDVRNTWLSPKEEAARTVADKVSSISKACFFHATSENSLKSILLSKRVEVRHEKAYKGAFVSTQPEFQFGRYVLAFKRNIERLSKVETGFASGSNAYWAGFSGDIPVSESSLAYVLLQGENEEERSLLELKLQELSGRKISVVSAIQENLSAIGSRIPNVPREWPDNGEDRGQALLQSMGLSVARPFAAIQRRLNRIQSRLPSLSSPDELLNEFRPMRSRGLMRRQLAFA